MVRMIHLKRGGNHGIAVGNAIDDLPRHHPSNPAPKLNPSLPPTVNTGMGMPRRRWEKGSTPKKTHPPPPCATRRSRRRQTTRPSKASLPPAIHYRYCSRSLIQLLYLRHRFVTAYLSHNPTFETHNTIQSQHFSTDSIDQLACRLSTILDTALFDFRAATTRLDNIINEIEDALENDTSHSDLPYSPLVDSIEHLAGAISLILDEELLDFNATHKCLDNTVRALESAFDDDDDPNFPPTPSITSDQQEMPTTNLGPTAHHMPLATAVSIPLPSTPIYHQNSADLGTTSGHPTPVSSTPHG
jgi:hypothetical protein